MTRAIPWGVIYLVAISAICIAIVIIRDRKTRDRLKPDHCSDCGRPLTEDEMHYYGRTCERCEGVLWAGFNEAEEKEQARKYGGAA